MGATIESEGPITNQRYHVALPGIVPKPGIAPVTAASRFGFGEKDGSNALARSISCSKIIAD
jgi:hypothetical protein